MTDGSSLGTLAAGDFHEVRGGRFRLTVSQPSGAPAVSLDLELAAITELGTSPSGSFRAPFSLSFHGPLAPVVRQGIYRLEHERLGALDLFLVPVGPTAPFEPEAQPTTMSYEAVFG